MKRLKQSIETTIETHLSTMAFDWKYFQRIVIAGMIADGFAYIEMDEVDNYIHCLDRKNKRWVSYNLYGRFSKLTSISKH